MSTAARLLTLADYAALDEPDERFRSELVRGRVVREPLPSARHSRLQFRLAYHFGAWTVQAGVQQKVLDYLGAGARLVWIVDPEAETVLVHRPDGSATLLRGAETLTGEDVLPGFALGLAELFAE